MKRTLLTLAALLFVATGLIGCHASADVDPHGASQLVLPR